MIVKGTHESCDSTRRRLLNRRKSRLNLVNGSNLFASDLPWYCQTGPDPVEKPPVICQSIRSRLLRLTNDKKKSPKKEIIIYRSVNENRNNLNDLFSRSSVPGLRELTSSRNLIRRVFWVFAFLLLSFLALFDIHQLMTEFYSYPITVDVRLRESRKLPFPAVTVCNLNIVRYSALCNSTLDVHFPIELREKLCGTQFPSMQNKTLNDINDISRPGRGDPTSSEAPVRSKRNTGKAGPQKSKNGGKGNPNQKGFPAPAPNDEYQPEELEITEREEKELQENLTTILAVMMNVDKKLTYRLGHQFEDMILRCTMKSSNCTNSRSFESSFTPTEGNCYTYKSMTSNRRGRPRKQEETSLAGVDHGLELVLNLEVGEYLPGSSQIGALVMVHSPDDFGTTASEAIFVAPERTSYIGLKMVKIGRLPSPYPEHCIDTWPAALRGGLTQNTTYSQQIEFNNTDLRICDTRKKNTRKCVEEVMFRPDNKIDTCLCPPRCQVIQYDKTVSLAKWPTREDKVSFDRGKNNINFQNVAKVVVYFQTMTLQEVMQQKSWTTAKLLSSLGGFMGMYVGFSFLSLFEVFEVIFRRVWYSFTRKTPKFKTVAQTVARTISQSKRVSSKIGHSSFAAD